ncbi:MAG: hypothetical protein LUO80_07555 [Methylococcaceae bacterium]|nr:hypothetical protein [Methylococcaceae bacterium]
MSKPSAAPLHLILERSRVLQTALVAVHGLTLIAALANPLPGGIQLLLGGAVLGSLFLSWQGLGRVRGLTLNPDDEWEIIFHDQTVLALLAPSTILTPWLVILHLTAGNRKFAIPICRDALDPESFRQLRVYLRIAGHRALQSSSASA